MRRRYLNNIRASKSIYAIVLKFWKADPDICVCGVFVFWHVVRAKLKSMDLSKKGISLSRSGYTVVMAAAKQDAAVEDKGVMLTMRTPEQKNRLTVMVTAGLCIMLSPIHQLLHLPLSFPLTRGCSHLPFSLPFVLSRCCFRIWYVTVLSGGFTAYVSVWAFFYFTHDGGEVSE